MLQLEDVKMVETSVASKVFEQKATVTAEWLTSVSNVLDTPDPGKTVPALWHWMLFQGWPPRSTLRSDGGVDDDPILPSMPEFPRRMAASGTLTFNRPLRLGDRVIARSALKSTETKTGKAGPLVFVTIKTEISVSDELAIAEESKSVFMKIAAQDTMADSRKDKAGQHTLSDTTECFPVFCDPILLFQYSALTSNSHRIHYDYEYAMSEGLCGIVVQGPLQATWLASTAQTMIGDRSLASFQYFHRNPAYCEDDLVATGQRNGQGSIELQLRSAAHGICTEAAARY